MNNSYRLAFAAVLVLGFSLLTGCLETDSADSVVREVDISVAGFYAGNGGAPIVGFNSGSPILSLDLRQFGDRLEATDNNGSAYKGSISRSDGSSASFTLEGRTTAGAAGIIIGTISVAGDNATMRGTWAEDATTSSVAAVATVPTNSGGGALAISPASATVASGATRTFSATGGTPPYAWSLSSGSLGSLSSTTGTSVTYTASGTGTQTLTVTDSAGGSRAATITQ